MSRPKANTILANTTESTFDVRIDIDSVIVKNEGDIDCFIDFDRDIDTNDSYNLEAGETLTLEGIRFRRLHHKTNSNTTTIRIIRLID